ncbi:MAG: hypothetical protein ACYTX0_41760 [Nostoc sp.]
MASYHEQQLCDRSSTQLTIFLRGKWRSHFRVRSPFCLSQAIAVITTGSLHK